MSNVSQREAIAKDFGVYSFGFLITQAINVGVAIYVRKALGPVQMGVWVVLQVFLSYTKYTSLGLARAIQKEIPFLKGQGKVVEAENARNTAFSYVVLTSTALCLMIAALAFYFREEVTELVFYSSLTIAVVSVFQRLANFCTGILRAEKAFSFAAKYSVISAVMSGIASVILIHFFGLYGYYVAMTLSVAFNLVFLLLNSEIALRWRYDFTELRRLMRLGIPLFIGGLLGHLMYSLDKIMIGAALGVKTLGVYSISLMANNVVIFFPNIMNIVLWPNLSETYGRGENPEKVLAFLTEPAVFVSTYLPVLIGALWIGGEWGVQKILPEYVGGVGSYKICMFATLFMILSSQLANALVTFKRHWQMIPAQAVILGIVYGGGTLALLRFKFLETVAIVYVVGYAVLFLMYSFLAYRRIQRLDKVAPYLMSVFGLIAYYAACLLLLDAWFVSDTFLLALGKGIVFLIAAAPVLIFGEKRFRAFQFLFEKMKIKLARN